MSIEDSASTPSTEAADQPPPPEPWRSPIRGSTLLALLVLALTAAGGVYLRGQSGVSVLVSTRDLPAFHRITQADLLEQSVPKSSLPATFISEEDAVVGKYTTAPMEKSDVFFSGTLGPRLDRTNPTDLAVTALDATPAQALSGALAGGDRITLVMSPDSSALRPVVISGVLVLDTVAVAGRGYVITFGLDSRQVAMYTSTNLLDWRLVREDPY